MIVNPPSADVLSVFRNYLSEYEIQSMRLIDDYWTGDGVPLTAIPLTITIRPHSVIGRSQAGEICQIMPTDGPLTLIHSRILMYGAPRGSFSGAMKMRLPMLTAPAEILM